MGLFDYIKKLLIQNNISLSSFKKYPLRNIEASDSQNGLHHNDLNLMQPGDVMVNISKSDSSVGSSSTDPTSSSNAKFGHAAIWVKKRDPEKYNPYSYVAMSAWSKPKRKYYERNYEVGYDLRECRSGRLSCKMMLYME